MTLTQKLFMLCDYEPSYKLKPCLANEVLSIRKFAPPKVVIVSTAHENNWIYDLWVKESEVD